MKKKSSFKKFFSALVQKRKAPSESGLKKVLVLDFRVCTDIFVTKKWCFLPVDFLLNWYHWVLCLLHMKSCEGLMFQVKWEIIFEYAQLCMCNVHNGSRRRSVSFFFICSSFYCGSTLIFFQGAVFEEHQDRCHQSLEIKILVWENTTDDF